MLTVIHQYSSDVDKGQLLIKTLIKEHLCLNSRNAMKINTKPLLICDEHVVKMFLQKASENLVKNLRQAYRKSDFQSLESPW